MPCVKVKDQSWGYARSLIVCPWWMCHHPSHLVEEKGSTSQCGCFPSSFLYCIHPMLVSQRSALQPGCMWGGFCRFLSSGLSTLPPPIWRDGYITARGFLGYGSFTPPHSHVASLLSLSLSFIHFPRHTFFLTRHVLEAHLWSETHKSRHTHTLQMLLFKSVCSWTHSCLRIFPIRILTEVNLLRYCYIRAEQALPVASPEKCTFPVQFRWWWPVDSMFFHAMCKRWILKPRAWRCCSFSTCHVTSANWSRASHLWKQ